MEQIKTEAIVIRSINWSESSKIITLFSRELGLINVIAKGARKKNSQYQGLLESLNAVEAIIYISAGRNLQILGNIELEQSFHKLRQDLNKTGYALSILELINIFFLYSESDAIFYDFLLYIISFIENHNMNEIAFWYFILKLTSFLGFRPEFSQCHKCHNKINFNNFTFSFSNGSVICARCGTGDRTSGELIKFLDYLQNTKYRELNEVILPGISINKITVFLIEFLRYHTDQNLRLNGLQLVDNLTVNSLDK
jgi:DNA repair protein RecO (recombination protein O)